MPKQRVFSVDGDPLARRLISRYLSKRGYTVIGFASVAKLESSGETRGPDIVICDVECCTPAAESIGRMFPQKREIQYIQLIRTQAVDDVVSAFRHKNRDCLPVPFSEKTLVLATERAQERRYHIAKNLRIRRRLEKAMGESEKRLSILRADQLAGRQVQKSLLPWSPLIDPPYYMAQKVLPSLYLSGDFVNYMPAFREFFLFYLMDVSGHGASSAFVTVMIRQLMHRIVRRQVQTDDRAALTHAPENFLETINEFIQDNEIEKHLTIFCGCLDRFNNHLKYAVGAQSPMPILIVDGEARFLEGRGKPVGLFPSCVWKINELKLPEKFILIAFTDGILEILPRKTLEGKEAYLLDRLRNCDPDIESVIPTLGLDIPGELPDDIGIYMMARGYHGEASRDEQRRKSAA